MHWYPPPQAGDIVECRFPQDQFPTPGPKKRPALVISVSEFEVAGLVQADVTIAYGTSVLEPLRAGHFLLSQTYRAAGLARDTKFDLTKQCTLPFNDVWFCAPPGKAQHAEPQRGRLPLEVTALKKAFIAALRAAQTPVDLTAAKPNLARTRQKPPQQAAKAVTPPKR